MGVHAPNLVKSLSPDGFWRLNDAVGSGTALDISGNGRHLSASCVFGQSPGPSLYDPATAAAFPSWCVSTSTTDFGYVGNAPYSFFSWIKLPASHGGYPRIVGKQNSGASNGWGMVLFPGNYFGISHGDFNWPNYVATITIATGVWTMLAATYDGSVLRAYINGAPDNFAAITLAVPTTSYRFAIGADDAGFAGDLFTGHIGDTAVFPACLSGQQVADIHAAYRQKWIDLNQWEGP